MNDMDEIRHHLDAVAGAQLAYTAVLASLLTPYKGNPQAIASLENDFEASRAGLLGSVSSDYKIAAFDMTAETILELLRSS